MVAVELWPLRLGNKIEPLVGEEMMMGWWDD